MMATVKPAGSGGTLFPGLAEMEARVLLIEGVNGAGRDGMSGTTANLPSASDPTEEGNATGAGPGGTEEISMLALEPSATASSSVWKTGRASSSSCAAAFLPLPLPLALLDFGVALLASLSSGALSFSGEIVMP